MERAAVFIKDYSLGNSPALLQLCELLAERFALDLWIWRVAYLEPARLMANTRVFDLGSWAMRRLAPHFARAQGYRHVIAVDPHGFVASLDVLPDARPIYYSLELYVRGDPFGDPGYRMAYPRTVMDRERGAMNIIRGLIIQSAEREAVFRREHALGAAVPAFHLPVTCRGPARADKARYLRDRHRLPDEQRIALHLGGIRSKYASRDLALAFAGHRGWTLFFQGDPADAEAQSLRRELTRRGVDNVVLPTRMYSRPEEAEPVIRSADVGLAWYRPLCENFIKTSGASGKIAAYLQCGVPVIANRTPSLVRTLETPGCGVCVETPADAPEAGDRLVAQVAAYAGRATAEFEKTYRFERYAEPLLDFLERSRA